MSDQTPLSFVDAKDRSFVTRFTLDPLLLACIGVVVLIGLVVMGETLADRPSLFLRHVLMVCVGIVLMYSIAQVSETTLRMVTPLVYLGSLGLLLLVLFFGDAAKGAMRWIDFPLIPRFQPSEVLKLALPLSVAWYLGNRPAPLSFVDTLVSFIIILVPLSLVYMQPDLGTTVLTGTASLGVVFMAGLRWRWVIAAVVSSIAGIVVAWRLLLTDYQITRITTFLDPEAEPLGAGWNIIQSKIAIGSGGVLGKGLGEGSQSQLSFLPEGHTDFILSVIGEELGFIGTSLIVMFFFFIFARGMMIGRKAPTRFAQLAIVGITLMYFGFMIANTMMVVGLLPVVGAPLPLVSYGGTSIITFLSAFGVVIALQRQT